MKRELAKKSLLLVLMLSLVGCFFAACVEPDKDNIINMSVWLDRYEEETIEVEEGNPTLISDNGALYSEGGKTLVIYPFGIKSLHYEVKEGTENIAENIFKASKTAPCAAKALIGIDTGVSEPFVAILLLGIGQNFICLVDFLEFLFRFFVVGIQIRVVFASQLLI